MWLKVVLMATSLMQPRFDVGYESAELWQTDLQWLKSKYLTDDGNIDWEPVDCRKYMYDISISQLWAV